MNFEVIRIGAAVRYGGLSRHPLLCDLDPTIRDAVAKRFCYSSRYNFTYQRVPKSANSTIVKTLAAHMSKKLISERDARGHIAKRRLRRLPGPQAFAASYSFSFVRDPAMRVLSAWQDKAFNASYQRKYGLADETAQNGALTFAAFLRRLQDGLLDRDLHWRPQSRILIGEGAPFRFIGRVEKMDTQLPQVMEEIFGHSRGIQTRNLQRTGSSRTRLHEVAGRDDLQLIERLYARDYELYEAPPP